MPTKKKSKAIILQPKVPKKTKKAPAPKTKRSVIVHKSEKAVENLYQMLGQIENTIEELARLYTELPDSKHYGVGGKMKPSLKQEIIAEQLRHAQIRAARILRLIEKAIEN